MEFGIYAGSVAGDDRGGLASGPPDDPVAIADALGRLQGPPGRRLAIRAYLAFTDDTDPDGAHPTLTPCDAASLCDDGRVLDLVAQYQSRAGDVAGYERFVGALVDQYGPVLRTLQIAEEPNATGNPNLDGDYPRVREAVVAGVSAAARRGGERGHEHLRVGFNTTVLFGPATSFPADLVALGGPSFVADLDYVGLDFFPDVFHPVDAGKLPGAVGWLVARHREEILTPAGLGSIPIHITEHGWPTGPGRSPERQAEVVDTIVRALAASGVVDVYTHFALRDADSARDTLFHRFGLLTDDYRPKPAFEVYRTLIAELAGDATPRS